MATHRRLAKPRRVFRIRNLQGLFPIWGAGGALRRPSRWHSAGHTVIFASEFYSTAAMKKLAHDGGALPPNQHFVEVTVPAGVSYEVVTRDSCSGWQAPEQVVSRDPGGA